MSADTQPHWHTTLRDWLTQQRRDQVLAQTIWEQGSITARRRGPDGGYRSDHLERGLLLYHLIQSRNVRRALQVGIENGFSCAVMARAAADCNTTIIVDAVDKDPPDQKRAWPLHRDGTDVVETLSLVEVMGEHFPAAVEAIRYHTGPVPRQLSALLKGGARYGLIVLGGGPTLYDLLRSLCYCIPMLEDDGAILLERFCPTREAGLAAVVLLPHLRRLFVDLTLYQTEGKVWPVVAQELDRQAMVLASGHRFPEWRLHRTYLPFWKLVNWLLGLAYRSLRTFPLKPDVD